MAMASSARAQRAACSVPARAAPALRPVYRRLRPVAAVQLDAAVEAAQEALHTEAPGPVAALSLESWEAFMAAADSEGKVVIVDWYTDWCGPCKLIAPEVAKMAVEIPGIKVAKFNCGNPTPEVKKFAIGKGIKALPTFHAYRNGELVGTFVGSKVAQLRKFVEEHAATA